MGGNGITFTLIDFIPILTINSSIRYFHVYRKLVVHYFYISVLLLYIHLLAMF